MGRSGDWGYFKGEKGGQKRHCILGRAAMAENMHDRFLQKGKSEKECRTYMGNENNWSTGQERNRVRHKESRKKPSIQSN